MKDGELQFPVIDIIIHRITIPFLLIADVMFGARLCTGVFNPPTVCSIGAPVR